MSNQRKFSLVLLNLLFGINISCSKAPISQPVLSNNVDHNSIILFDNVSQLRNSMSDLQLGDLIKTKGYYEPGDGGGAEYLIAAFRSEQFMNRPSNKLTGWDQNRNLPTTRILVSNEKKRNDVVPVYGNLIARLIPNNGTIDLKQFGAKSNVEFNNIKNKGYLKSPDDSFFDNSMAIQNAIDYAKANGIAKIVGWGHYWCENQIRILPDVNFQLFGGLHTNIDQPFVVIYHSFNTSHKISVYRLGPLGKTNNVAKALIDLKTTDASAGVVLYNCRRVTLDVESCGFMEGLTLFAYGDGCVENTIFLRDILNNRIGVAFESENGGWVTQSQFYGGRIASMGQNQDQEQLSASIAHLAPSDQHTFIGINMEGTRNTQNYSIYGGSFCAYINCRLEKSAKYKWAVNSFNKVIGGYSNLGNQMLVSKDLTYDKRDLSSDVTGSIDNNFSAGGFNLSQHNIDYFDDLPHKSKKPVMNIFLNNPEANYILGGGRWFNFPEFLVSKEGTLEYYDKGQGFDLSSFKRIELSSIKAGTEYGTNMYLSSFGYDWVLRKPVKALLSGADIKSIEELQQGFQNQIQINRSSDPRLVIDKNGVIYKGQKLTWNRIFEVISEK